MMWRLDTLPLLLVVLTSVNSVHAETAAFDLSGPRIDVRVTRGDKTLPISQVPNLQPGDRIWLHPDLPEDQSAHYLLVAVFFRGSTNPPPDNWFTKAETWKKRAREEGIIITVPQGAQQVLGSRDGRRLQHPSFYRAGQTRSFCTSLARLESSKLRPFAAGSIHCRC